MKINYQLDFGIFSLIITVLSKLTFSSGLQSYDSLQEFITSLKLLDISVGKMIPSKKMYLIVFLIALGANGSYGLQATIAEGTLPGGKSKLLGPGVINLPGVINFPGIIDKTRGIGSRCSSISTLEYSPRCGSDGKTYGNRGALNYHNCLTGQKITVKHYGPCEKKLPGLIENPRGINLPGVINFPGIIDKPRGRGSRCSNINTLEYSPRCGSDGKTYVNSGALKNHNCWSGQKVTIKHYGPCENPCSFGMSCKTGNLCGSNGKTYENMCTLCGENRKLTVRHMGTCKKEPGPKDCLDVKLGKIHI